MAIGVGTACAKFDEIGLFPLGNGFQPRRVFTEEYVEEYADRPDVKVESYVFDFGCAAGEQQHECHGPRPNASDHAIS